MAERTLIVKRSRTQFKHLQLWRVRVCLFWARESCSCVLVWNRFINSLFSLQPHNNIVVSVLQ